MVNEYAQIIWNYMKLNQPLEHYDAVLVLGSIDERVAEYGAQLFLDGYGDRFVTSGGIAHTDDLLATGWNESEAEHFAAIARKMGVPNEKIIIEDKATNSGQNIQYTYQLLERVGIQLTAILLVHQPYMERRLYATFKKQWPDSATHFNVTSPPLTYLEYLSDQQLKDKVINIMIGDLQRIREYPKLGFQIHQGIPDDVWHAFEQLVKLGYDKHLIKNA
jgi:uncharacterized SAM-binding protein YcdF (DUF218 family)